MQSLGQRKIGFYSFCSEPPARIGPAQSGFKDPHFLLLAQFPLIY